MVESSVVMTRPAGDSRETASTDEILLQATLRLSRNILGLVLGFLSGLLVFVATNILVLKGGDVVGPHLGLLSQFFIGYSVSFVGSFIGAAYGFALGYTSGAFIAWIYNVIAARRTGAR